MLNAHQAYNIATAAEKDKVEQRFKCIIHRIKAAAADGKYYCGFYYPLQDELVERLTNLGYKVNNTNYTIEWRNK